MFCHYFSSEDFRPRRLVYRGGTPAPDASQEPQQGFTRRPEKPKSTRTETGVRIAEAREEIVSAVSKQYEGKTNEIARFAESLHKGGYAPARWRDWNDRFAKEMGIEKTGTTSEEQVRAIQRVVFTKLGVLGKDPNAVIDGRMGPYTIAALAKASGVEVEVPNPSVNKALQEAEVIMPSSPRLSLSLPSFSFTTGLGQLPGASGFRLGQGLWILGNGARSPMGWDATSSLSITEQPASSVPVMTWKPGTPLFSLMQPASSTFMPLGGSWARNSVVSFGTGNTTLDRSIAGMLGGNNTLPDYTPPTLPIGDVGAPPEVPDTAYERRKDQKVRETIASLGWNMPPDIYAKFKQRIAYPNDTRHYSRVLDRMRDSGVITQEQYAVITGQKAARAIPTNTRSRFVTPPAAPVPPPTQLDDPTKMPVPGTYQPKPPTITLSPTPPTF